MENFEEKAAELVMKNNESILLKANQKSAEIAKELVLKAKEEIEAGLKTAKEAGEELEKKMNEAVAGLRVEIKGNDAKNEVKNLASVIEDNKDSIQKSLKAKGSEFDMQIKADTLRASVVGNADALILSEIGQLAHRKLTAYDLFPKVPVGTNQNGVVRYVDWDLATTVRAAAAVAEGAVFAESTARWTTETLDLKKVGDQIPMSEELAYDSQRFAAELQLFLSTNVDIKVDADLINGAGTGSAIKGINAQVSAFVPVASGIVDASIYDLAVKVAESITSTGGAKYNVDFALMNIADINKMRLKKDTHNNYIQVPFADRDGSIIAGVAVLECNAIAANTAVFGDSRYAKIYEIPGVTVTTGFATGDFESDMMTMKAKKRLNLLVRNADQSGFRKVTSISAALVTLATP